MAAGEREQILADFQACTQLDDIETCIAVLDQHDWNLTKAVQSVMSEGSLASPTAGDPPQVPTFPRVSGEQFYSSGIFSDPIPMREQNVADSFSTFDPGSASGPGPGPGPSTSTGFGGGKARMLHFVVEYRDKTEDVFVNDTEPVAKIKEELAMKLGIPVSKQELKGWQGVSSSRKVFDNKLLKDLNLPKENTLYLLTPELPKPTVSKPSPSRTDVPPRRSTRETGDTVYSLKVTFKNGSKYEHFNLRFEGRKTVREVKCDMVSVTDLPVRNQLWTGWPEKAKDESLPLYKCGLTQPTHALELTRSNITTQRGRAVVQESAMDVEISDEDDVTNYHAYDDSEMFTHDDLLPGSRKQGLLMPETVKDEMEALEHFTREFRERYGECHPVFYVGSLDNCIKDSIQCKAKERKQLAIYLHHDGSILSNVFCSQILCSESVVNYLSNNFIAWAWDMTLETNKARLVTMATRHFGSVVATQLRGYSAEDLPVLLIISRSRGSNEVVDAIKGDVLLDELMTRLIHNYEVFHEQQQAEILEEEERDARETIRREQEVAYQESLAADKAKMEAKREEERKKNEELRKQQEKEFEEERKKKDKELQKQAIQQSLADLLPDEPSEDDPAPMCKLRIRTPDRSMISRRFYASDTLKTVINFITTKSFHIEEHKLLTTYPRRDLTQLDCNQTLQELNLCPQETLILEEKS